MRMSNRSKVLFKRDQAALDGAVSTLNTDSDLKANQTALDEANDAIALKADEATLASYATTSYVNANFLSAPDIRRHHMSYP